MKRTNFFLTTIALIGFIALLFTGCSKDLDDETSLLGEWIEESPVEDRTELYFYAANRLTMTTDDVVEDFRYRIEGDSIYLKHQEQSENEETPLYFRQINENSFQIGNLHPSIPESEPTYMIFRRKSSMLE